MVVVHPRMTCERVGALTNLARVAQVNNRPHPVVKRCLLALFGQVRERVRAHEGACACALALRSDEAAQVAGVDQVVPRQAAADMIDTHWRGL